MATTVAPSDMQVHKVPLKVWVDEKKNKVLFAEAGKDFVDVLLSFLTLPLGTIARLVAQDSNIKPVKVGSLSSLYQSLSRVGDKHLWTQARKEMLLHPKNSMASYCRQLKLNIDDTQPMNFLTCNTMHCSNREKWRLFSFFSNQKCSSCGKLMDRVESRPEKLTLENGFVKETATFIISDDLSPLPNVLGNSVRTSIHLLRKLGVKELDVIKEQTVYISKREVVDFLKLSLLSKTPLTDFIIDKKHHDNLNPINQFRFYIGEESSDEDRKMVLKVLIRKSNKRFLFAEADEKFTNIIFSFLDDPLGAVLHSRKGTSSLSCIDKLYKSMIELSSHRYFRSEELKEKLANPLCVFCPQEMFVKGPSIYLVTDDLVVTPMSAASVILYLNKLNVPEFDVEERVITIGMKEVLGILNASLTSTSALTDGLKQFKQLSCSRIEHFFGLV